MTGKLSTEHSFLIGIMLKGFLQTTAVTLPLCLALTSCVTLPTTQPASCDLGTVEPQPAWVWNPPQSAEYIYSTAYADIDLQNPFNAESEASRLARNELSKQLFVKIESSFKSDTTLKEVMGVEYVERDIRHYASERSNLTLEKVETQDKWIDRGSCQYHVLVRLKRTDANQAVKSAKDKFTFNKIENSFNEMKANKLEDAVTLDKLLIATTMLEKLQQDKYDDLYKLLDLKASIGEYTNKVRIQLDQNSVRIKLTEPKNADIFIQGKNKKINGDLLLRLNPGTTPFTILLVNGERIEGKFNVINIKGIAEGHDLIFGTNEAVIKPDHINTVLSGLPVRYTMRVERHNQIQEVLNYTLSLGE